MKRSLVVIVLVGVAVTILTTPVCAQSLPVPMSATDLLQSVGAAREYYCFGMGVLVGAAVVTGNWWVAVGSALAAYNAGCF